jgi:hypothetical protein
MRTITIYQVGWSNSHASGLFPEFFTNRKKAEQFGNSWKNEMVAMDEDPKEARAEYEVEIFSRDYYVEKDSGIWYLYGKSYPPRSPIVRECPYRHLIPSLINKLKELDSFKKSLTLE